MKNTVCRNDSAPLLRMSELVAATGAHRQTIHAYLREGLLPPPSEGAGTRNARYEQRHVDLIRLIQQFRRDQGLSLEAIRRQFEEANFDPQSIREASACPPTSLNLALDSIGDVLLARDELAEAATIEPEVLERLEASGVVSPRANDPQGRFDGAAVSVLSLCGSLLQTGVDTEMLSRLVRLGRGVSDVETTWLLTDAAGDECEDASLLRTVEGRYELIDKLFSVVRLGGIKDALQRLTEVPPRSRRFAAEATYRPSSLFIKRFGIDGIIARHEDRAQGGDQKSMETLGRIFLGLGCYAEAEQWLSQAVGGRGRSSDNHAYLAVAQAMGGRSEQSVRSAELALELGPESARAWAFLGVALAMRAAQGSGFIGSIEALREAFRAVSKSKKLPFRDAQEHIEVLLARGRLYTVLPSQLPKYAQGVADLEQVLAEAYEAPGRFHYPGASLLFRVHACFFLGVGASRRKKNDRAEYYLRECITLDPQSNFAERAYALLTETC